MSEFIFNGPKTSVITLVLAHGAGGPMDSPFMETIAKGIAKASGIRVARFEFPYMRRRRESGKGGAPDAGPALMQSWRETIAKLGGGKALVIGGKSLGGRIASMIADECGVRGLVCLGYPFHPPGKPEATRTQHLENLRTPALILQGTRDTFGQPEEVARYKLSRTIRTEWLEDGDHSFKPRPKSGRTEAENLDAAIAYVAEFIAPL
ncbi:alpha/beta hydrolase [Candidatus Sumerlaeota bacterium]|nr:alpha/beta hydrolase [Candidatus Sumerlaeota bacterium]